MEPVRINVSNREKNHGFAVKDHLFGHKQGVHYYQKPVGGWKVGFLKTAAVFRSRAVFSSRQSRGHVLMVSILS